MEKTITPILAIETSDENCGVALFFDEKRFVEINHKEKNVHSEVLLKLIETVLQSGKISAAELSAIAISSGPGSFTGLRIGTAAAKGLALGVNLPIIPVPTFDALAFAISNYMNNHSHFHIVKKANVKEHYVAEFRKTDKEIKTVKNIELYSIDKIEKIFSKNENAIVFSDTFFEKALPLPDIRGYDIAKYAYLFGKDLLTFEYDFLEPNYFKNFIPKVKK